MTCVWFGIRGEGVYFLGVAVEGRRGGCGGGGGGGVIV